jgi:hypothetical protein
MLEIIAEVSHCLHTRHHAFDNGRTRISYHRAADEDADAGLESAIPQQFKSLTSVNILISI